MQHRAVMIGAGGIANAWQQRFLPPFADRLRITALVDVNRQVLDAAADRLGVPPAARFTDMHDAFAAADRLGVDCCIIAIPPAFHKEAALGAMGAGLAVLSEKPIADTWESAVAIYRAVKRHGARMQIIQNYRYDPNIRTLKAVLDSGRLGRVRYVVGRFAADYRRPLSWGAAFRHEIPHTLLIEGAVHHFDQIRNLAGANCATISGVDWLPEGADSFKGECVGLFVMRMTNGVMAQYEGSCLAAGRQQTWHEELYRIECEGGALVTDSGARVWIEEHTPGAGLRTEDVPLVDVQWPGHQAMIAQFVDWLDGGPIPPTVIDDNMQTTAMLFGGIAASVENRVVDVQTMVADALRG
jgi:predicted dehydrogenase